MTTPFQQQLIAVAERRDAGTACPDCGGYGEHTRYLLGNEPGPEYRFEQCETCQGTGLRPAVHLAEGCPCLLDEQGQQVTACTAHGRQP